MVGDGRGVEGWLFWKTQCFLIDHKTERRFNVANDWNSLSSVSQPSSSPLFPLTDQTSYASTRNWSYFLSIFHYATYNLFASPFITIFLPTHVFVDTGFAFWECENIVFFEKLFSGLITKHASSFVDRVNWLYFFLKKRFVSFIQ